MIFTWLASWLLSWVNSSWGINWHIYRKSALPERPKGGLPDFNRIIMIWLCIIIIKRNKGVKRIVNIIVVIIWFLWFFFIWLNLFNNFAMFVFYWSMLCIFLRKFRITKSVLKPGVKILNYLKFCVFFYFLKVLTLLVVFWC